MRILVVEDDTVLAGLLADGLRERDMVVDVAHDGVEAINRTSTIDFDVVVLDRDLPLLHGDAVCRALTGRPAPPRILMLTAATAVDDRVEGLILGADDYLGKPFAFSEFVARILALARRPGTMVPKVINRGDLTVDVDRHEVSRAGTFLHLTPKEFGVLVELLRAEGGVVSAEHLLNRVWDENTDPFTTAPRTTIKNLRAKLGPPDLIVTIVGIGYRIP
ncbi:MAG: response regulator transcription factor [Kineosporiaceae bacterium]|jgi:DNA-binding response OmpR family regulator